MNFHYRDTRKIDPCKGATLGDGTLNDGDRMEIGPTWLTLHEWEEAGLELPDLTGMRHFRWERLTGMIVQRDYAGLLMFDPLNIRYATDSSNMQLWNAHNPFRAVLLCADGYMVIWDYSRSTFLSKFNPLVREQRSGADLFYFDRGDGIDAAARVFAEEIRVLLKEHAPSNTRLAVDKAMPQCIRALEALGLTIHEGEEVTEKSRAVKGPDELRAMRCAIHSCERSVQAMESYARTNIPSIQVTENDVWAVLHQENIRRGGEWIETRLLASGPRTNPWFQECGPRIIHPNEIISFDTDMVGVYGICTDISRSWWIGDAAPPAEMVYAMQHAHEHIMANIAMLRPGLMIPEYSHMAHQLDERYQSQKYGCLAHGVGLCDEWPLVAYPDRLVEGAFDYPFEPGNVICVEALVGEVGGNFSIKLEEQVLITDDGHEVLSKYPFDPRLMGNA